MSTPKPYTHILVAVDLTEECDPVIYRASASAEANGATLSLIHIVEPMPWPLAGMCRWTCHSCNNNSLIRPKSALIG